MVLAALRVPAAWNIRLPPILQNGDHSTEFAIAFAVLGAHNCDVTARNELIRASQFRFILLPSFAFAMQGGSPEKAWEPIGFNFNSQFLLEFWSASHASSLGILANAFPLEHQSPLICCHRLAIPVFGCLTLS